jgi:hypothetical protein
MKYREVDFKKANFVIDCIRSKQKHKLDRRVGTTTGYLLLLLREAMFHPNKDILFVTETDHEIRSVIRQFLELISEFVPRDGLEVQRNQVIIKTLRVKIIFRSTSCLAGLEETYRGYSKDSTNIGKIFMDNWAGGGYDVRHISFRLGVELL